MSLTVSVDVKHHVYLLRGSLLAGTEIAGVGRGRLYVSLHCHHQNDSCIRWAAMRAAALPLRLNPVLNWANVCSPNILRTLRRTMIRFLIELLVRRTWFGQSKLYFVLTGL